MADGGMGAFALNNNGGLAILFADLNPDEFRPFSQRFPQFGASYW
jgi:hypothetical protein